MSALKRLPRKPKQLLKPEAYISEDWLAREKTTLFGKTWHFACTTEDLAESGDFLTKKIGDYILFVMRDSKGKLKAYHNICRHRGTELLEGKGNTGKTIVCPYHRWTFGLDGQLRGLPDHKECFPDLNKSKHNLLPASLGEVGGLVFIHPSASPNESFKNWIADVPDSIWPHEISSKEMVEYKHEVVYEMRCNWKVFFENAIDGYHLAYLHKHTLGGPDPDKNVWNVHGRHLIWYSTERDGKRDRNTLMTEKNSGYWEKPLKHIGEPGYGGVYMLFPTTIVTASPVSFAVSVLEPVNAETTLLRTRIWTSKRKEYKPRKIGDFPGYDKKSGRIKSSHWKTHPLETGDFQTEDVWIVEKMQKALHSLSYDTSQLAVGPGAEAPVTFFQSQVLDYMKKRRKS